jgi:hypothetical protein
MDETPMPNPAHDNLLLPRRGATGRRRWLAIGVLLPLVQACTTPGATNAAPSAPPTVALVLHKAWFEGREVGYVTTDVSDADMARQMGANHAPRLAAAAAPAGSPPGTRTATERVYKFAGGEQINIFPSAPQPIGPTSANRAYSPLWQVVLVRWAPGRTPQLLRSEEALLAAAERGDVALTVTPVVVNCPVVIDADGRPLPRPL